MKTVLRVFFVASLFFVSCNSNTIYSKYESIEEEKGWSKDQPIRFETEITEINKPCNVFIHVRHSGAYPYRNLFLFLHTTYPDGKKATDTIECILADETGKWLGSGLGDLWDNTIPFKKNARFPQAGKYVFSFEQAMRYGEQNVIDPLPMIVDMGLSIEKTE
jgi:gliding motility-associated lipoprotein GldH